MVVHAWKSDIQKVFGVTYEDFVKILSNRMKYRAKLSNAELLVIQNIGFKALMQLWSNIDEKGVNHNPTWSTRSRQYILKKPAKKTRKTAEQKPAKKTRKSAQKKQSKKQHK